MYFNRLGFYNQELIDIYKHLLLPRMIEDKMLVLFRQGKVSKWFSGVGQEAISVGATLALEKDDWIMPLHRNLGVFTTRHMPLHKLFIQWQGGKNGYTKGRERSFHFGSKEHFICGMISHLGAQLSLADGVALAYKLKKQDKVSMAFTGDGGTSEGDFHEALNVAAVWGLPVIFIIENNGYGLSTPTTEQYKCEELVDRAKGYGMKGASVDGNNILQVYDAIKGVRAACLKDQMPYYVELRTFRMGGHEEASTNKYVPKELLEEWALKDPINNYEQFLIKEDALTQRQIDEIRSECKAHIDSEWAIAEKQTQFTANVSEELGDIYASRPLSDGNWPIAITQSQLASLPQAQLRFLDAIKEGLHQSLTKYPNLVLMGQDIAEYGGVFKMTDGFVAEFGKERIRNTPLCESAIVGTALGLSLEGYKSVVEMQFADFATNGFTQIVNNLAKIHYRWGQNADVVIRMPTGAGLGAGPFHSQSNEAWFTHVPGLKVVYPSSSFDAKGLIIAAINDPNPVLFFEHKALYRKISGNVPTEYYEVEIGKANLVNKGDDITIITYGAGVHWALEHQKQYPETSLHILDLRTLLPLDYNSIAYAVQQTGRVLILHEDTLTGGIGGEIAAWIGENCFAMLDAPVLRCASLDTPVPFNTELEKQFLAKSRLHESVVKLMGF
ncbi:thiamine pyrophosphate-dependent enzyme [Parasediminibacterium sp. JCM 36343]|uniref:alpha-ketoacid dehydrogenase subunit alpha/beta n=1 Tax=Parasediminibacterium sp. JCM 36343 TaxID=3374279 RepID=UPI003979A67F